MSTTNGSPVATVIPNADADACGYTGCRDSDGLVTVDPDDPNHDRRTVCSEHLIDYLEELRR